MFDLSKSSLKIYLEIYFLSQKAPLNGWRALTNLKKKNILFTPLYCDLI